MPPSTCDPAGGAAVLKIHAPAPPPALHPRRISLPVSLTVTTWTAEEWAGLAEPIPGAMECPNGVRFLLECD